MNWERIESITYADCVHPMDILGFHEIKKEKLIQAFYPNAEKVVLRIFKGNTRKEIEMECVDESGFYTLFVTDYDFDTYEYDVYYEDKNVKGLKDPYFYKTTMNTKAFKEFIDGNSRKANELFGAKICEMNGVEGTLFSVYAPNALSVSLVGDFNEWNDNANLMEKDEKTGCFMLFVPNVGEGEAYQYNLKVRGTGYVRKTDPYAYVLDNNDSKVTDIKNYKWKDSAWIKSGRKAFKKQQALNIYEMDPVCFFRTYNAQADYVKAVKNIKDMNYTAVKLLPVGADDDTRRDRFHFLGLFSVDSQIQPANLMAFIDECHKAGIAVIMDFAITYFSTSEFGLGRFDGSALFEHEDSRKGYLPMYDGYMYQLGEGYVKSYLMSAAGFYIDTYHVDGISIPDLAALLYLDYGRNEYVPNEFGGNTNTEAVSFIRGMNAELDKKYPEVMRIAELAAVWENITGNIEDSLGFDYTMNSGFSDDIIGYGCMDPFSKGINYSHLLRNINYAFNERFILPFSYVDASKNGQSFVSRFSGSEKEQYAVARAVYAYRMLYPGKKLTFMGNDCGILTPYETGSFCDYFTPKTDNEKQFNQCVKAANKFYIENELLCNNDSNKDSIEFINAYDTTNNILILLRKDEKGNVIITVANFSGCSFDKYRLGVPMPGKYKEAFNSDACEFGGNGMLNDGEYDSIEAEYDGREQSLDIKIPALSVLAFSYRPFSEKELAAIAERKRKERIKLIKEEIKGIEDERDRIIAEAHKNADGKLAELNKQLKALSVKTEIKG